MDKRFGKGQWGPQGTRRRTSEAYWRKPLLWNSRQWMECPACGWRGERDWTCPDCDRTPTTPVRQRVFCASLADVFEDKEELEEWRSDLFRLILNTPNLDWLLLTKRPENVTSFVPYYWKTQGLPDNVWIGTSVENQETADQRIPHLLKIPARVRFLSMEPLLGPVDLYALFDKDGTVWSEGIDWVIVGGESGPNARPMHPDWVRSIRGQCQAAGVPFFFKQWGEWLCSAHIKTGMIQGNRLDMMWPWATGERGDLQGDTTCMLRIGKKAAGRLLNGREWSEFPQDSQQ